MVYKFVLLNKTLTGQMNVSPVERLLLDLQSIYSVSAARELSSTCGVLLVDAHVRAGDELTTPPR